ncbi:MAG TPA: DUF4262 domain-containing protein [Tahibacter sp.]|nr:DUF4262 domain-containing protein [Tahibacter sp.]
MTIDLIVEKARKDVDRYGWHCVSVLPDTEDQYEYSYSVGFTRTLGYPEISIFGLPSKLAAAVIGNAYEAIRNGVKLEAGRYYTDMLQGGVVLKAAGLAAAEHCAEYFGVATGYAGGPVLIWVVLWPNRAGTFPDEVETPNPQSEGLRLVARGERPR